MADIPLDLDKDVLCHIKNIHPKIYSEETCMLLPININCFLAGDSKTSGIKTKLDKEENVLFEAKITINYTPTSLGTFSTFAEAKLAYASRKKEIWLELLEEYKHILPKDTYECCLQYDFAYGLDEEYMMED